jgi:Cof subfamily protein (haloacid dehalogenase superfamily)
VEERTVGCGIGSGPPIFQLLVLDIDGTLVAEDKVVPPGVVKAIHAAQVRGVRVCLATGRQWTSARRFIDAVAADPPVIAYNGALLYDFQSDRTLWVRRLSLEDAHRILPVLREFPKTSPLVFVRNKVFADKLTPFVELYGRRDAHPVEIVPDLAQLLSEPPMKFLVVGEPPDLERLSGALSALGSPVNQVKSQREYLEILPPGIDKGVALRELAKAVDIPLERVVAVGDNMNDLTMIQTAGWGIAVEGGPSPLIAAAKGTCPPPEQEGVRVLIERLFLHPGVSPDGSHG